MYDYTELVTSTLMVAAMAVVGVLILCAALKARLIGTSGAQRLLAFCVGVGLLALPVIPGCLALQREDVWEESVAATTPLMSWDAAEGPSSAEPDDDSRALTWLKAYETKGERRYDVIVDWDGDGTFSQQTISSGDTEVVYDAKGSGWMEELDVVTSRPSGRFLWMEVTGSERHETRWRMHLPAPTEEPKDQTEAS